MYKVTKKFARGSESPVGSYKTMAEAKQVIQEKLAEDAAHKVMATYCLYEGFDLMEEFDQSKLQTSAASGDQEGSGSSSSKSSSQSFRPTPFSMTPAPKGTPRSFIVDEDKKKDEDK
jgi:hypothetical protein